MTIDKHPLIISVSGLRGIVGDSLRPDEMLRYVAAYEGTCPPGPIVMGRDGRPSGEAIVQLIAAGLRLLGRDVLDADVAATPTIGRLVRQHHAAAGIQVTASHNPAEYNGMKLFQSDGQVLSAKDGEVVLERFRSAPPPWSAHDGIGSYHRISDTVTDHLHAVLALVDVPSIRACQFRVLLDINGGAGGQLGLSLLEQLGCQVVPCGAEPVGTFRHPPEPTADNLQGICERVRESQALVGFCQDPDADRLALIDADGCYVGEEYTLAICVDHVLRQHAGPVVTNCSTSRMTEEIARLHSVPFTTSKVGEANVVEQMRAVSAVFGGEGNGGPIDPRVGYVRDSFVGMALVLDAMAARNASLRQLLERLPKYYMVKDKVELAGLSWQPIAARLLNQFADAQVDQQDGLRWDWHEAWLLIRPSNTEPIVRVMAEATTPEMAQQRVAEAIGVIRGSSE